jgi:Copper type II ascorbate-dependent monooxygenase, C-terminal domain
VRIAVVIAAAAALLGGALAVRGGHASSPPTPTYYRDVAPILDEKCTTCHRLGGIAPFPLTTEAAAKANASGIVRMTQAGAMPPWMPGPDSAPLRGRDLRRLTRRELATLAAWAAAGAPAGNPADLRTRPSTGAGLGGPGRTIRLVPAKAYLPHAAGGGIDDYHCFVLDPRLDHNVFVTGALIRPERTGIVHHVILYEAAGSQAQAARQLNAAGGGKGWTCFGGPDLPVDLSQPGSLARLGQPPWIAAWVPGHTTNALPDGTGVLLHAHALIVMQVHYNLIEAVAPDRSQAWLRVRPAATGLIPLQTQLVAAPVELPCPRGDSGARCTRSQAIADVATRYGVENAFVPDALLQLCDKTLADYPTKVGAATAVSTSCNRTVRSRETIFGVAGHMHLRGRDIRVELDPGTPKQRMLLHIPAWDFHWQDVYYLEHPIHIGPGDTIRVSCTFDNSAAAQPVIDGKPLRPRYVVWGEGTTDEMCLGMLSVANGWR